MKFGFVAVFSLPMFLIVLQWVTQKTAEKDEATGNLELVELLYYT